MLGPGGWIQLPKLTWDAWRPRLSLSNQFLLAAALVLCLSMAVLGTWVNHQITRSVLATSGSGGGCWAPAGTW